METGIFQPAVQLPAELTLGAWGSRGSAAEVMQEPHGAFEMSGKMRSRGKQGRKSSWAPCSYSEPVFLSVFVIVSITSLKCELAPNICPGTELSVP